MILLIALAVATGIALIVIHITSPKSDPLCAWCLKEKSLKAGRGSHGICAKHKQELLDEFFSNAHMK